MKQFPSTHSCTWDQLFILLLRRGVLGSASPLSCRVLEAGRVFSFPLLVVQDTAVEKQPPLPEWAAGKGGWLVGVREADYSAPHWQRSPRVPPALGC